MARKPGRPEYDPDDPDRYIMMADDPDHCDIGKTDWLRQHFDVKCKQCNSTKVSICEDQHGDTEFTYLVCDNCGNHVAVADFATDE